MKYLSVCSGIEAATVAWHKLGWEPVGFSEIEKFPNAVLAHHYPDVPNFGDMTDHERWPEADIDVLVGGTPCQSFSVAGLRKGMADPRGNLALIYLAIAEQYRPKWLVWENVPGVLSSNEGRDFGSIIGGMVELGYSPCWRVLDAQYFGVPQRRRRVFIVASSRHWTDSAKVLFEPESLLRNPAPSRGKREGSAEGTTCGTLDSRHAGGFQSTQSAGAGHLIPDIVGALSDGAHCGGGLNGQDAYSGRIIPALRVGGNSHADYHNVVPTYAFKPGQGKDARSDGISEHVTPTLSADQGGNSVPAVAHTLRANQGSEDGTGRGTPIIPAVAYNLHGGSKRKDRPDGGFYTEETDVAKPLDTAGINPTANQGGTAVAFRENQRAEVSEHPIADALLSGGGKPGNGYPAIRQDMAVRRLTPMECERLQGFPDNYTNIPGASDSGRYKALGNSMAVPVMHWIGKRINDYEMC